MATTEGENLGFLGCFGKYVNLKNIYGNFSLSTSPPFHVLSLYEAYKRGRLSVLSLLDEASDGDQSGSERLPT